MKIAVIGTGSWGSALAKVLSENNHDVIIWGRSQTIVDEINQNHSNEKYLPNVTLPTMISATTILSEAINNVSMILLVIPTNAIRNMAQDLNPLLSKQDYTPTIVHASKGLEMNTQLRISEVLEDVLDEANYQDIVVLSGPSHAEEVARKDVTTLTAASHNLNSAKEVQQAFMNSYFRVYTNTDVVGVELGGALKNIIAVGAGIISGLGYGDNAKAALITRGLAEISRLGIALGADPLTFIGLSGVGDLIVTCTSPHSRNFQAGTLIAKGYTMDEVTEQMFMVVEGVLTVKVAYQLAQEHGIDMPITEMLYLALYEDKNISVEAAIKTLMLREGKQEESLDK
ncbi:NAD(P)H-dependent glycerol-3-phosphate dehydrogenase [Aerococcaceae bacterium DSM 111021]|nr:NAD(P)H-dependent glycerol-3-phosphate dehydrogenase [Aerococcaceae bacterium DSM 111021]